MDARYTQKSALSYFTHRLEDCAYDGWYRPLEGDVIEVLAVGLNRTVPLAGRSPDDAAGEALDEFVRFRQSRGLPVPTAERPGEKSAVDASLSSPPRSANAFEPDKPGTPARDRAEAAIETLRQRGGIFVEAVRATRMAMALTDPSLPGNPIVFANQSFLDLSGYDMDEVLGQQPYFMNGTDTDPGDAEQFRRILEEDRDGLVETVQYAKNGRRFVATVLLSAFKDAAGHTLHHFLSWADVTRRVDAESDAANLRRMQAALRESEARFRAYVAASEDVVYRMSPDWSELRQLQGQTFLADTHEPNPSWMERYIDAADRGTVTAAIDKAIRTKRMFELEHRVRRADGSLGWAFSRAVPVLDEQGEISEWIGAVKDVSTRRHVDEALRDSEAKYRTLFETMGQGYCELELVRDAAGRAIDQLYLELNPAFERLFGVPVAEARGRKASEVFPGLEPLWTAAFDRVAKRREPERIEHPVASLGRWFEVFAHPAWGDRLVVLYEDITERKHAEIALRESEELRRIALESGGMGTWTWDTRERWVRADDAFQRLWGVSFADRRHPVSVYTERMHPEGVAVLEALMAKQIAPGEEFHGQVEVVRGPNTGHWIQWRGRAERERPWIINGVSFEITGQRLAEQKLRESEEKYRTLFESVDEGFITAELIYDAAGRPVDALYLEGNPAASRLTGGGSYNHRLLSELVPATDDYWIEIYGRVARTGTAERLERFLAPLDRWYNFFISRIPAHTRSGQPSGRVAIAFQDVTDRKRAEAALLASEERLRAVLQQAPLAIAFTGPSGEILFHNSMFDQLWGCPGRDAPVETDSDAREGNHLEGRLVASEQWRRAQAAIEGEVISGEAMEIVDASGKRTACWLAAGPILDPAGQTLGGVVIFRDVSEERRTQEALRQSEERLRDVLNSMIEGFALFGPDFTILEVNDEALRLNGRARSELVGRSHREAFPGIERSALGELFDRVMRERTPASLEHLYAWHDGQLMWLEVRAYPNPDGRVASFWRDITDRKTAEAALRRSEAHLEAELRHTAMLRDLAARLVTEASLPAIYEEILAAAVAITRSDAGTVQVYDQESNSLVLLVTHGIPCNLLDHFHRVDAASNTACGIALRSGQRVFIDFDDDIDEACRMHVEAGYRSSQATPLLSRDGSPIGMINTHWRTPGHRASEDQLRFLDLLARQAADLIEQRRAEDNRRATEERLRQFGEASQDVLWIRDAQTLQWTYLTPAFETIYGLSRDEVLTGNNYRSWMDLILPEDRQRVTENFRRVCNGEHATFDYRIRRPSDRQIRWLRNTGFPITDQSGNVALIGGIAHDLTESRETELRLKTLVQGIPQLVWRAADGGRWTWASSQWEEYTGLCVADSRDWGWLQALHPADRPRAQEAWDRAGEAGGFEVEYRVCNAAEKDYRWFQTRATPVRDDAGGIVEWLGTSTDIHELRELQERQRILVAELQHRTRNLMGVVMSTAERMGETSDDFPAFRYRFRDRLEALARVQGLLSRLGETDRVAFDELIRNELIAMHGTTERVTLDGPSGIRLRSSMVQTLAIALHELATNAVKYGALGQPNAHLSIAWRMLSPDRRGRPKLHIDWRESGVRMPSDRAAPQGGGQGRELIEAALPYQLNAETSFELRPDGVHCTITIPVSQSNTAVSAYG